MKQVYLLPLFLTAAFGMNAWSGIAPLEKKAVSSSVIAPPAPAIGQDTIITRQDTAKVAYVREDDPKMKKKPPRVKTTRVTYKRDVRNVSLSKQSAEGNLVDVIVMQSGRVLRDLEDVQLVGNSGSPIGGGNKFTGFENINVPFEGTVRFRATNQMGTATIDREVRFTIMETGRWVVKIDL